MDHNQATKIAAVERYLLEELTPEERNDFEEHYFDCQICASDLKVTAAFMDSAKTELQESPLPRPQRAVKGSNGKSYFASLWPSMLVWSALAACLMVIVYQNFVIFPRFRTQVAELRAPEVLPVISLVRGNSRGGEAPVLSVGSPQSVLLSLDIPSQDRFRDYTCLIYSPQGELLGRVPVSSQAAKDTVSLRVPTAGHGPGKYTLTVQGNVEQGGTPVDLGHYSFVLQAQP
jgi:hypothetical protein